MVFNRHDSRQISMQAWLPGSLPAEIKKSLFPSYPEKRTSVCYPCYHLHSQPAHTVCLFEYDCPVSGLQSGQHQRYSSQDNGCFPSQPTLLTIWVRNSGMYSGKYLLRLSSAGCFLSAFLYVYLFPSKPFSMFHSINGDSKSVKTSAFRFFIYF